MENDDNNDEPLSFQSYLTDYIFEDDADDEDDKDGDYNNSDDALKWLWSTSNAISNEAEAEKQFKKYKEDLSKEDQKNLKEILLEFNPYHIDTQNPLQNAITQNVLHDWLMHPQFEGNLLF